MKTNVKSNIEANKELMKGINKVNYYDVDRFISDSERYIKAIKDGRMICAIKSVSSSGMSRNIKFLECSKGKDGYRYYNFFALLKSLGFTPVNDSDSFRIGGCGMDMIFHTNYTIIHRLHRLGMITKKQCANYCQMTPSVI